MQLSMVIKINNGHAAVCDCRIMQGWAVRDSEFQLQCLNAKHAAVCDAKIKCPGFL